MKPSSTTVFLASLVTLFLRASTTETLAQNPGPCCGQYSQTSCAGCVPVNNCGTCNGTAPFCDADSAQICAAFSFCSQPGVSTGNYSVTSSVACFYKRKCVAPLGCPPGDCTLAEQTFGHSAWSATQEDPGAPCP
jgi:hypothetical protein